MKKPRAAIPEKPMRVVSVACGMFNPPADLAVSGTASRGANVVDGFAVTHGVPADVWDVWQAANIDSDIVQNALIYAIEAPAAEVAPEPEPEAAASEPELEPEPIPAEQEAPTDLVAEPAPEAAAEPAPDAPNEETSA